MEQQRQNLKIIFHVIQPEVILDSLERTGAAPAGINSRGISWDEYRHFAEGHLNNYSIDELENFYRLLCQDMEEPEAGPSGVFQLLFQYGRQVLKLEHGEPVCRFSELLGWRTISHPLGQDIFTTSYLAWSDWRMGTKAESFFWPPVIKTDNYRLQEVLDRGLSENHFHLNGSSQSFALSWACLMNHPRKIYQFFETPAVRQDMRQDLTASVLSRASDHRLPWEKRLLYAAWLRAELFRRFSLNRPNITDADVRGFFKSLRQLNQVENLVQSLRFLWGNRVQQPNRTMRCLDYVFPRAGQNHNRLLAGERQFLYWGFSAWLQGKLTALETDLFYLYLLLKAQFRGEIVQINGRVGFKNFSLYQDRKEHFWETVPEYQAEGRRLAVSATLQDNNLRSLETRITPKNHPSVQHKAILNTDRLVFFAENAGEEYRERRIAGAANTLRRLQLQADIKQWAEQAPYFYVVHFIKNRDKDPRRTGDLRWLMRNHEVRVQSRQMALALAAGLDRSRYLRKRICGIDAASFEIGCRPETFATEFRYLKSRSAIRPRWYTPFDDNAFPQLRATYHVGEDFLDIANGLRAIDEAIQFLQLERGDRLGHILALGVDPERYYAGKNYTILLSKQDRLDDLVWLLFRSMDLGIRLDVMLREKLRMAAEGLFEYLYQDYWPSDLNPATLRNYYMSMSLRGDHPECYKLFDAPKRPMLPCSYRSFMEQADSEELDLRSRRQRKELWQLCHLYHFGVGTKRRGKEIVAKKVDKAYIDLMRSFQERFQRYIGDRGLMIECNPTSNYLIGTFGRYDEHPIFRFNDFGFGQGSSDGQLSVSINTDDQGVFDTSLENEYALLACCMGKARLPDGSKRYSRDAIYQYLDHVRQMGNGQSFRTL